MSAVNGTSSETGILDSPRLQDVVGEKMEDALRRVLFNPVPGAQPFKFGEKITTKVTVVGVGNVGMACAQTILTQDLCGEIALVDVQADKLRGEMLDLQHGAAFMNRAKIVAGTDYKVTAGSDVCIVTAGARQREGESRLSLVGRNVNLLKSIIPELVKYSPDTILLLVSNPVDILTHCAWKISGLPPNRVIGSGTNLDSSRFRFLIADALGINAQNVHAHIVGEHGDSSVPMWSSAQIAGIPLVQYARAKNVKLTDEVLDSIHKQVVNGAYEVIKLKGYTSWAIGYSVASLIRTILHDTHRVHPVSVPAKGFHGIKEDVYLSLPALLGRQGLLNVMEQEMTEKERAMVQNSAKGLADVIAGLDNLP